MLQMKMCIIVIVILKSGSSWVINNVDLPSLRGRGFIEDSNEVDVDDPDLKFSLIYPDSIRKWLILDSCQKCPGSNTYCPGSTKWCGAGNIADGYDDLGSARETDMCCRDHDFCPDIIEAGETRHNLTNNAFYTRLSCACDEQFRQCLRATKSKTAKQIGTVYFNALGTECFREDYPVIGCNRRGGWLNRKCLEPRYDTEGERRYQWFDVANY